MSLLKNYIQIDPSEFIDIRFWDKLSEELDVVYKPCQDIPDYFYWDTQIENQKKKIIISADSDFSIYLQQDNHPNKDLLKLINKVDWLSVADNKRDYLTADISSPFKSSTCRNNHRYSSKVDSYTCGTFPYIPDWVKKWYCTNLNISHPKCQIIPFGLNNRGRGFEILPTFRGREKKHLLYVNFQNYTDERVLQT